MHESDTYQAILDAGQVKGVRRLLNVYPLVPKAWISQTAYIDLRRRRCRVGFWDAGGRRGWFGR